MVLVKGSADVGSHPHSCQRAAAQLPESLHQRSISTLRLPPVISLAANRLCRIWA